jgi:Flp pilus assembly protein TadG
MNPNLFRRFLRCTVGAAAIEAAIVFPILLILVIGLVDLSTEMFIVMEVNNAAQAGAASAVQNQSVAGVASAMTNAAGGISISATPAPTFGSGSSGGGTCPSNGCLIATVTASYTCTIANKCILMPRTLFTAWVTNSRTITSTVTVRIQ